MRGKVNRRYFKSAAYRITPACAGKRYLCNSGLEGQGDHPRVCGEKPVAMHSCTMTRGSPPRVRGKVRITRSTIAGSGITPACAGKRQERLSHGKNRRDHPRVCGEKQRPSIYPRPLPGSPPRVRGKVIRGLATRITSGITPACAGKSVSRGHAPPAGRDHPRVCGEKDIRLVCGRKGVGSPPRVRGKDGWKHARSGIDGITPACAGKSLGRLPNEAEPRDHPRVCGEKLLLVGR